MGCPRCGSQNKQVPLPPVNNPRPGTVPPKQAIRVNPSDAVRNAITGLRYVPNGK